MFNNNSLGKMVEHARATNTPIDATPMKLLATLVSTQKGWFIRQALKGASALGTIFTTQLVAHGVSISDPAAITAALSTLFIGVLEMVLSKLASPIAATK